MEGSIVSLQRENGFFMMIDFDANTLTYQDFNAFFMNPSSGSLLDVRYNSGFNENGETELFQRDAKASFDRYGDMIVLELDEYDIRLIHDGDGFYIPLQTANDFFISPTIGRSILFNGEAMFLANASDLCNEITGDLTALGEIYYSAEPAERSQALADFGYNELCLALDSMYGLKEQHSIDSFDRMFWQIGFDEPLVSTNPGDADQALSSFINYYLDDLHSGFSIPSWMTGLGYIQFEDGPSSRVDGIQTDKYEQLRARGIGEDWNIYEEVGNTAYITFDQFEIENDADYYGVGAQGEMVPDTVGLIIYANQQICRENSPIENVVID